MSSASLPTVLRLTPVRRAVARMPSPSVNAQNGGGGGGGGAVIDPIIQGLLARLPKSGDVWPEEQRKLWLQLLEGSFRLIYKDKTEVA
jgi:hypothetical protein